MCSKFVKQFLDLVNFYRRHIPNLAAIARPLIRIDFYQPAKSLPVEESHYAKELVKELKHARQLAQKCIVKAQHSQKCYYDNRSKRSPIMSADLVMMKVEPKF